MTVKELIELLKKIEDQDTPVFVSKNMLGGSEEPLRFVQVRHNTEKVPVSIRYGVVIC